MKSRLDKLLVDRNLAQSRERAQALILAGRVLAGPTDTTTQRIDKPGTPVDLDIVIRLLGNDMPFVSRGGLKLKHALEQWSITLTAKPCLDIGASTGGFTDCMLQAGALSVLAIDTGYGQIAESLRRDPRVTLMERTNARLLEPNSLAPKDAAPPIAFIAMDVSFISATLVLPAVLAALATPTHPWQGELVLLIKPQFEAGREHVGKGGIVRTQAARQLAIDRVTASAKSLGAKNLQVNDSPITGMEGNHEYLLHALF